MKTLAIVLLCSASALAQCGPSVQPVAGSRGLFIQSSQPGLLGLRNKTRSTLILPIGGGERNICPPCDDDDEEDKIQIELLRQIVTALAEKRQEQEIEQSARENRELLMLIIELVKQRRDSEAVIMPLPQTSRQIGWRPSSR